MTKREIKISADDEVQQRLHNIGARYGMSGNAIVAAAAYELSRVRPENLWHALGRIADGEALQLVTPATPALPASRRGAKKAIAV